jgi:hypothetical protein
MKNLTKTDLEAIARAVWARQAATMPTLGIGEWLYKKLLTIPRFLGLK